MSKGSNRRPTDEAAFAEGFDRIFGKKKLLGSSSMVEQATLTGPVESSNLSSPATFDTSTVVHARYADKPKLLYQDGDYSVSCLGGHHVWHKDAPEGLRIGKRHPCNCKPIVYIDDATGKMVDEDYWP